MSGAAFGVAGFRADEPVRLRALREGLVEVRAAEIPDVKIIEPRRYFDQRGFFSETYNERALMQAGIELESE